MFWVCNLLEACGGRTLDSSYDFASFVVIPVSLTNGHEL